MVSDETYQQELSRVINGVWGDTEADKIRHTQARQHFMVLLFDHLQEKRTLTGWTIQVSVAAITHDCHRAVKHLQELRKQGASQQAISIAQAQANASLNAFLATRDSTLPLIVELSNQYIRQQIGVSWDWLAIELVRVWFVAVWGWATNEQYVRKVYYEPPRHPAPPVTYHFETKPDESHEEMLARFKEETAKFHKEQTDAYNALFPKGRLLKNQDVERYVEWFFRSRIMKEPIRHIAMHDMVGKKIKPKFAEKQVRDQIDVAEKWLSLGFTVANLEETRAKEYPNMKFSYGGDDQKPNSPASTPPKKSL